MNIYSLLTHTGQLYGCLLTEAAHLSPTAFSNVLNLGMGLLPPIQHTMPPIQPTIVLTTQGCQPLECSLPWA